MPSQHTRRGCSLDWGSYMNRAFQGQKTLVHPTPPNLKQLECNEQRIHPFCQGERGDYPYL